MRFVGQELAIRGEDLSFRYPYIYYYFAAVYLRDHIGDSGTRASITHLASHLQIEDYHGVLLFLAHLTRDPFVIGEISKAAQSAFEEFDEARLEADVEFLGRLNPDLMEGQLTFEEKNPEETRRAALSDLDMEEEELASATWEDGPATADDAPLDLLGRLTVSLRTLQLLGQVLRNHAGVLQGDEKLDMAKECYGIGLRTLASYFSLVDGHEKEQIESWAVLVKKHFPKAPDDEIFRKAAQTLAGMSFAVCFGSVLRVAEAVGSDMLGVTHQRLLGEAPSAAYLLIDAAIRLGRSAEPSVAEIKDASTALAGNVTASRLLQILVLRHFHLFDVRTRTKQMLCSALGIEFRGLRGERPSQRRIGPGA